MDLESDNMENPPRWMPTIGMKFNTVDEAWNFWLNYGRMACFEVRKQYNNKSQIDGVSTSCRFVCSKAGHRGQDKRDHLTKNPRAETRTDCKVRMGITLNRVSGTYELYDLVLEHNHILQLPATSHLMASHRRISNVQAAQIEMADASGIRPKDAHELASRQAGGPSNLSYTRIDHRNYLRTKRQRRLEFGEAGGILQYFADKCAENPSFYSAIQLDCEEQITNMFWADARMLIDYAQFGDVVSFDTTFGTNKDVRPLGVFVGFNHFREIVVFGATLLYDETAESFEWLFKVFLRAHGQKHPRTIYTDQDIAMKKAISLVFPETWHGLCTFHIMQNAITHLARIDCDGSSALKELSACMFEYEDESTFEKSFNALRSAVQSDNTWLRGIYEQKEKWAECFMKNVYTLGMRSTQLSESFNKDLKTFLKCDLDIARFFVHFDRAVASKRAKEVESEFNSRKKLPRIKLTNPLLVQASKMYTTCIFEAFQVEYERSTAAYARPTETINEYIVGILSPDGKSTMENEYRVVADPSNEIVLCSCKQFERIGIPCSHALKVLDILNVKLLPEHYIMKRWTREARCGTVQDMHGRTVLEDPKIDATRRYQHLSRKFLAIASRAAEYEEIYSSLDDVLSTLDRDVEDKIKNISNLSTHQPEEPQSSFRLSEKISRITGLKKRVVKNRSSRRNEKWTERLHKKKKRRAIKNTPHDRPEQQQQYSNLQQQQQEFLNNDQMLDGFGLFTSFTELLTGRSTATNVTPAASHLGGNQ